MVVNQEEQQLCAGCNQKILDKYLCQVMNKKWHCECLKCVQCQCSLQDKCWTRQGNFYCQTDYHKLFTRCNACKQPIDKDALAQKVSNLFFHVHCFQCSHCAQMLNSGDQCVLHQERLFCMAHYPTASAVNSWPAPSAGVSSLTETLQHLIDSSALNHSPPSSCPSNLLVGSTSTIDTCSNNMSTTITNITNNTNNHHDLVASRQYICLRTTSPALVSHPGQTDCVSIGVKCEPSSTSLPASLTSSSSSTTPHSQRLALSPSVGSVGHPGLMPGQSIANIGNITTSSTSIMNADTGSQLSPLQPVDLLNPKNEHPNLPLHISPRPFQHHSQHLHPQQHPLHHQTPHSPMLGCYQAYDGSELCAPPPPGCGVPPNPTSLFASIYAGSNHVGPPLDLVHNGSSIGCHDPSSMNAVGMRGGGSPMVEAEMENGGVPAVRKGRPRKRKQSNNPNGNKNGDMDSLGKALHEQNLNNLNSSMHLSNHIGMQMGSAAGRASSLNGLSHCPGNQRTKRQRTSFKHNQLKAMKSYFQMNQNPDARELNALSNRTALSKRVLQVWFQNARAKWRRSNSKGGGSMSVESGFRELQLNESTGSANALPGNQSNTLSMEPSTPGSSTCMGSPDSSGCTRQFSTPSPNSAMLVDSSNGSGLMTSHASGPGSSESIGLSVSNNGSIAGPSMDSYHSPAQSSSMLRPGSPSNMHMKSSPAHAQSAGISQGTLSFSPHSNLNGSMHSLGPMASLPAGEGQLSPLSASLLSASHMNSFGGESLIPTFRELY